MASDIGVKMGVSGIAQFKQSMQQAQQSVKTLDAELKLNEKQLKASGDRETYVQQKSKLLQQQIAAMNKVVKEGQNALSAMQKNGVDPASKAYQQMQQRVLEAQSALLDMEGDLSAVGQTAQETAQKTNRLTDSLSGINRKVSFDAVLNGIGMITTGMEAAARRVEALARDVWDTMASAAAWADNENMLAAMYDIDVETLQRMQGASRTIDTSVEAIIKSRQKLKQNMLSETQEIADAFGKLEVDTGKLGGLYNERRDFRAWEDVFWATGEALLNYNNEIERDVLAQQLLGRSWMELMPLFKAGREEYEKTLADQTIVTEENVDKLNALDDALQKLDQDYQATKNTILSELAPAFTIVGDTISGLIREFNAYLQTDEGQEKLEALGAAVTDLFEGLSDADFGAAIDTASGILTTVTDSLGWIKDNHKAIEDAVKGIGIAFVTLKAAQVVGTLVQSAAALKTLLGGGAAAGNSTAAVAAAAAAAGAAGAEGTIIPGVTGVAPLLRFFSTAALGKTAFEASQKTGSGLVGYLSNRPEQLAMTEEMVAGLRAAQNRTAEEQAMAERLISAWEAQKELDNWIAGIETSGIPGVESMSDDAIKALATRIHDLGLGSGWAMAFGSLDELYQAIKVEERMGQAPAGITEEQKAAAEQYWDFFRSHGGDSDWAVWDQLVEQYFGGPNEFTQRLEDAIASMTESDTWAQKMDLPEGWWMGDDGIKVDTTPELSEDAADHIQEALNGLTLTVPVIPDVATEGHSGHDGSFANGLPFVPFDGYIAQLHKGERIVPANQNKNYSATSNLYVESMYMNNGTDAQALAAAMAAENRRIRAGFGS